MATVVYKRIATLLSEHLQYRTHHWLSYYCISLLCLAMGI